MNVIVAVRMADLETLSGPRVPSPLTVQLEIHAPPASDALLVLLVRPGARGRPWQGRWVAAVRPGGEACLPNSWLEEHGLPRPRGAWRADDEVCFLV